MKKTVIQIRDWQSIVFNAVTMSLLVLFLLIIGGLILTEIFHMDWTSFIETLKAPFFRNSLITSIWTSVAATALSLVFAIPAGYALSRMRPSLRIIADTIVDLPIVFPPFVIGLILLVFFKESPIGIFIQDKLRLEFMLNPKGIVLCQFLIAASFAVRFAKMSFDAVDHRCEQVAFTLGCGRFSAFRYVTFPLAKEGIIAGAIITWARSFGLFGPLLIFVGSMPSSTQTLSTAIHAEQSAGNFKVAFAASLLSILIAAVSILVVRILTRKAVVSL